MTGKQKNILAIFIGILMVGGVLALVSGNKAPASGAAANNVRMENGVQIIEINAKAGYQPQKSVAKAGVPTIIRFKTGGTFDCSASVRIPSMNVSEILPRSGTKDIDLGTRNAGPLVGSCGMGMYPFEIDFQS